MTLDDTLILAEKEIRQRPSNPVLEEHKDDPVVKHLWSRKEINVKELIPDKFEYVSKLGAASWKEAPLVYESIGELKIPRVIKIINETEFTKMFRDADSKDKIELMKKELLDGNPNSLEGLAFAYKEVLKNGELAMVEEFLPSSIEDINFEYRTFDENLEDLIGFAKGINSMHTSKNKIWGDGKPEHFRYTDSKYTSKKIPKLNDFGTASKGSWSMDKKQATGDFLYRAPETFKEYFRADKVNDVYSFGAVAYYMFTGEDLNKELFDTVTKEGKNLLEKVNLYEKFMSTVEEKELKKYYKRKVKKLPKKIRNTIFDMIRPEQYKYEEKNINKIRGKRSFRYQNGKEILEALEEIKQNQIGSKYLKKVARKSIGPLAFTTVIGAGLLFGFYLNRTYEPKDLTYPEAIPVMELIELGNQAEKQDTIKFDREPFIPEETCTIGMAMDMANRTDKYRLNARNNFHILNLSIAYIKAATSLGGGAMFSEGLQEN
ncbi:hypothetical protein JXA48_03500 [Candidatus Woesearchaeota archaeon]|nr:hypothetical protein [Candidatus Woesearchaeota archaeon]